MKSIFFLLPLVAAFTSCTDITLLGHVAAYDINGEFKADPVTPVAMNAGFESHSFAAAPHAHSMKQSEYAKSDFLPVGDVLPTISRLRIEGVGTNDALGGLAFDFVSSGATGKAAIAAAGGDKNTPALQASPGLTKPSEAKKLADKIAEISSDP